MYFVALVLLYNMSLEPNFTIEEVKDLISTAYCKLDFIEAYSHDGASRAIVRLAYTVGGEGSASRYKFR